MAEQERLNLLRQEGKLVTREVYGSRTLFEGLEEEEEEEEEQEDEDDEGEEEQEEVDDDERKEENPYTGMSSSKYHIPPSHGSASGPSENEHDLSQPAQSDPLLFSEDSTRSGVSVPVVPDADKLATLLSWGCEVSDIISVITQSNHIVYNPPSIICPH